MKKRFIFDENYIKRYAKKDKMKWLIIGLSALVLIIVIIIVILAKRDTPEKPSIVVPSFQLKEEIKIESGDALPEVVDYFSELENIDIKAIKVTYPEEFEVSYDKSACTAQVLEEIENLEDYDPSQYDCIKPILITPDTYGVVIELLEEEYTVNLVVVDTTAPEFSVNPVEIYVTENYSIDDFVSLCYDASDTCEVHFYDKDLNENGSLIDYGSFTEPGEYIIRIVASDKYENVSEVKETKLTIKQNKNPLYMITFNSNGGTNVNALTVEENNLIQEPTTPVKDGYTFLGWYLGNSKFDFTTPITRNMTLTAKWEKISAVSNPDDPHGGGVVNVTSVSLNYRTMYFGVGDTKTVKATVNPNNATNQSVGWASSNSSVATVSNGVIKAVGVGEATITATAGGKSASVQVIVRDSSGSSSCAYGDANYNTNYILSVNLIQNNCAVNPNVNTNVTQELINRDYISLKNTLTNMGLGSNYTSRSNADKIYNLKGTGIVGYQVTITLNVIDPDTGRPMSARYILKSDGTRQFISNNISKNNVSFK